MTTVTRLKPATRAQESQGAAALLEEHKHLRDALDRLIDARRLVSVCHAACHYEDAVDIDAIRETLGIEAEQALHEAIRLLERGHVE